MPRRRPTQAEELAYLKSKMDTLVKKIDAWGETHREQNSVTADSAGEEDAEEEHVRKRARSDIMKRLALGACQP